MKRLLVWLVVPMALLEAGWLAFDGAHGLLTGDYVTPSSGPYAGQLGPWSELVEAVGLEPRSSLVMGAHLALGAVWLVVIGAYLRMMKGARRGMFWCAVAGLWYLPFGTLLSVLQIGLLSWSSSRGRRSRS